MTKKYSIISLILLIYTTYSAIAILSVGILGILKADCRYSIVCTFFPRDLLYILLLLAISFIGFTLSKIGYRKKNEGNIAKFSMLLSVGLMAIILILTGYYYYLYSTLGGN